VAASRSCAPEVLVTCPAVISPLCVQLPVPLATALQRSLQHAGLVRDARTDPKTGLLNAAAWQEDAAAGITPCHPRPPAARHGHARHRPASRLSMTPTVIWPESRRCAP
jgi:hypothetical protein